MKLSQIKNLSFRSKFSIIGGIVLVLGVFVSVRVSQQNQENRSRASEQANQVAQATFFSNTKDGDTEVVPGEVLIKFKPQADLSIPDQVSLDNTGHESLRQLNATLRAERFTRVFERRTGASPSDQRASSWYKVKIATRSGIQKSISKTRNRAEFDQVLSLVQSYKQNPDVEIAEPNYVAQASLTPNDKYFSTSNFFPGHDDMWGLKKINIPSAWDSTTGNNVIVAVIDTGVDYNHPDLSANMWTNTDGSKGWDFVNNDNNPMDDFGHGTHVAGILGAVGNNSRQIPGVNWRVKIMAIKVLDNTGYGTFDNIALGLRYAADKGAKIANVSISGEATSQILEDAVNYEHDRGMLTVVAAGNNNQDVAGNTPANTTYALAVGATDVNDQKAGFSAYGSKIDVVAPGIDILSIASNVSPMCQISSGGNNYVCWGNGTSFATPQVAGVASLMLSKNPALTNEDLRRILRSTAQDLGAAGQDNDFGYGRIDAARALSQVSGATSVQPTTPPTSTNRTPVGLIDQLDCTQFRGWSYDPDKPSYSERVDIYIDGVGVTSIYTTQYRSDVNSARGITGNHGFLWSVPSQYKNGQNHQVAIYAIGVDANGNLNGENPQITAYSFSSNGTFGPCQSTSVPTPTPVPPTPIPQSVAVNRYPPVGVIDGLSCSQFRGWSYDHDKPSYSERVDIYIDGVGVTSIYTNDYRPDVNRARGITGNHGFSWSVPSQYKNGQNHQVAIYAIGVDSNGNLNGENPQITAYSFSSNGSFGPCF